MISITQLYIYPVKSLQGIPLTQAKLGVKGLEYDRNWMVVDANCNFITQRQRPNMARIRVRLSDDQLVLEHPQCDPLTIALHKTAGLQTRVSIWNDQCLANDEGEAASLWLTNLLGKVNNQPLKLVRFCDDQPRQVDPRYLQGENAHTGFADGFPFLVTSEESLALLNRQLQAKQASPVSMDRFRPNLVIRGVQAFEEDQFKQLSAQSNKYQLGIRKPCQRCAITTTDQRTGQRLEPKEPLQTLLEMQTQPQLKGAYFGQNAVLLQGAGEVMVVGDTLLAE